MTIALAVHLRPDTGQCRIGKDNLFFARRRLLPVGRREATLNCYYSKLLDTKLVESVHGILHFDSILHSQVPILHASDEGIFLQRCIKTYHWTVKCCNPADALSIMGEQ